MGLHFQHHGIGLGLTAFGHMPAHLGIRVQCGEGFRDPITAGYHCRLTHQNARPGTSRRIDQSRCEIARTNVLGERARHVLVCEFLQERRGEHKRVRHKRETTKEAILDALGGKHKKGRSKAAFSETSRSLLRHFAGHAFAPSHRGPRRQWTGWRGAVGAATFQIDGDGRSPLSQLGAIKTVLLRICGKSAVR